jgi:hypothetical protein
VCQIGISKKDICLVKKFKAKKKKKGLQKEGVETSGGVGKTSHEDKIKR